MPAMSERWLPVVGFEALYEVSDRGRVRRTVGGRGAQAGTVLRPRPDRKGYLRVALHTGGARTDASIHRLVLLAFVGPGDGLEGNHLSGDKADNSLANLEWATPLENERHAVATGLRPPLPGERNGRAKLTWDAVRAIRADGSSPHTVLAERYGVSPPVIADVRHGVTWREPSDLRDPIETCRIYEVLR